MNMEAMIALLRQKGFDDKFIQDRMTTFAGLKLPMLREVLRHTSPELLRISGVKQ